MILLYTVQSINLLRFVRPVLKLYITFMYSALPKKSILVFHANNYSACHLCSIGGLIYSFIE